jgi:hypothetical protein
MRGIALSPTLQMQGVLLRRSLFLLEYAPMEKKARWSAIRCAIRCPDVRVLASRKATITTVSSRSSTKGAENLGLFDSLQLYSYS